MIDRLKEWLDASSCNFLAVDQIEKALEGLGFSELDGRERWSVRRGGRYYYKQNGSAIFAFLVGDAAPGEGGLRVISAHSDSPSLKVKPKAEIYGEGGVVSINVEKYGGGILYTWFDRPLGLSGRVALRSDDPLQPRLRNVDIHRAVATIPHLAIHFNRAVNEGNPLSVQKDMLPVAGYFSKEQIEKIKKAGGLVKLLVAHELKVDPEEILDYELNFYPLEGARQVGLEGEYLQSGRIDDLAMAYAGLEALLATADQRMADTRVLAIFDNEETGSGTKQGAHSPVLTNVAERLISAMGGTREDFFRCIDRSFMISADCAHAWHPNYNSKYDPTNHPVIGGGPAVKINANCKYMTDADGAAVFRALADKAGVKCQYFVNHSDVAGGSTLGNIFTGQMAVRGVDMGAPIWAMHSAAETMGVADYVDTVAVFRQFFL